MIKKIVIVFFVLIAGILCKAQTPESFNYQAVLRDADGVSISGQNVSVRVSILQGSVSGTSIYSETHLVQTSDIGLINLKIGAGDGGTSDFAAISWGTNTYYLKIEIDEAAGTNYTVLGTSQLLSVPYALYSKNTLKAQTALNSDSATIAKSLDEKVLYFTDSDTLFAVKDRNGNIVFAVYPDGAKVYVNKVVKGNVGGFAVSGRTPNKATEEDYFHVSPDSTRVTFNQTVKKGNVGGFAVSGRTPNKAGEVSLINLFPDNYFIGHESGLNTTGLYNSFLGYNAGLKNSNGSRNIFIGYQSGYNNTTGSDNLALGNGAGYTNQSGTDNIFMGNEAGYSNTGGSSNMFFGYQAGYTNKTGGHNTFLGYQSGYLNEDGFYNVYIGYQSGYISGIDGIYKNYRNVFIGPFAGYNSSGVGESVYIGYDAGRYNVNGARNTFVGGYSGKNNTIGYDNSFYGNASGENTKGIGNTYIGSAAGWSDTASYRCTYVGVRAGEGMVTRSYRNTFIGGWAGQNKTGGDYNTLLGFGAGQYAGTGSGNIFIGYMAGQNYTGSNKLYIDNSNDPTPLIYGNFQNDSVIINGNFHVNGNITAAGTIVPDYVFDNSYMLETIEDHANFMWDKKHLPALKSAKEIELEGRINLNERREQILEELEKAHIYIEQLNKRIKLLEEQNAELNSNNDLEIRIEKLEEIIKEFTKDE